MNSTVTAVETFRFLGTTISQDLKWDNHIDSIVKKAQQRLCFLGQLRKFNLPQKLLKQFYSAIIETVLCSSITVWFGSATKTDIRRLQRTVRTAERIIDAPLPSLKELYTSRVRKRAKKVTLDPSHPAHSLFELLPSDWCCRSLSTNTARHKNRPYRALECDQFGRTSDLISQGCDKKISEVALVRPAIQEKKRKVSATQKVSLLFNTRHVRLISWSKPIRDSEGRTPPL